MDLSRSFNSSTSGVPETLIDGAVRKAKQRLVSMIIVMYLIAYIDRANLGFAALRMNTDLNLTPDLFGFAAGIFYVGYVIFEVPSNILLGRFGCNVWFARIMATWGLLSMATRMMDQERKDIAAHGHADLRASLLSPQVWILGLAYCATVFGLTGLVFWMPQIIKQFNFSDTTVGLLSTIPYIIGALVMCWWAARSDARKERFWHFIVPSLIFSVGFVVTALSSSPWIALFGMVISTAAFLSAVPVYYTLPASFLVGAASAEGMAVCNAVGNIGGFFGPWVLGYVKQRSGAPAALYLCAIFVLIAPALITYLRFTNKQMPWK